MLVASHFEKAVFSVVVGQVEVWPELLESDLATQETSPVECAAVTCST